MKTTLKIFCLIIFFPLLSLATKSVGNGGGGVLCTMAGVAQVQSWDLHYGRHQLGHAYNGLNSWLPLGELSALKHVLERLKSIDPVRFAIYSKWLQQVHLNTQLVDTKFRLWEPLQSYSPNCQPVALALQLRTSCGSQLGDAGLATYWISKGLWSAMPTLEKVGLLLHEIIYQEVVYRKLFNFPQVDSIRTEKIATMVSLLMSDEGASHPETIEQLFFKLGFDSVSFQTPTLCDLEN